MRLGHFVIKHEIQTKINLQVQSIEEIETSQVYEILFADENKFYNLQLKFILNHVLFCHYLNSLSSFNIQSVRLHSTPNQFLFLD